MITWTMAKAVGVSKATVQRVSRDNGLKPHPTKTFKLSHDNISLRNWSTWSVWIGILPKMCGFLTAMRRARFKRSIGLKKVCPGIRDETCHFRMMKKVMAPRRCPRRLNCPKERSSRNACRNVTVHSAVMVVGAAGEGVGSGRWLRWRS